MKLHRIITTGILLLTCGLAGAHDFALSINGQKLYFNIRSAKEKTAEVTYQGSIAQHKGSGFRGDLVIPEKVKHDGKVYEIVGISAKAFSENDSLTSVTMPVGIAYIGDFAFEGCTALKKIVFPGRPVKFGEGVFFNCADIRDITLGSDWTMVDLKAFRWSEGLEKIYIPAKLTSIHNMKSLKGLRTIEVDANNTAFSSIGGILYSKDNKTLYGCPRAYEGQVVIAPGTEKITAGALIDCTDVTAVDVPETVKTLSFREFSRMKRLRTLTFRGVAPLNTAVKNGKECFLLQLANRDVRIVTQKKARKAYRDALTLTPGEYKEIDGMVPFPVKESELPIYKNVIGVKKF